VDEGRLWPDWPQEVNEEISRLIARLGKLGIEVRDIGTDTFHDDEDVAGMQLPGFTAVLPGADWPGFDLSVRYHPFRRQWLLETQSMSPEMLDGWGKPVAITFLRNGTKSDASEIANALKVSNPLFLYGGSVVKNTGGVPLSEIAETAVVTAAIVPFVQAVAKRAGEDVYEQLKELITGRPEGKHSKKRIIKRKRLKVGDKAGDSYVYDPISMTFLIFPKSHKDEALRGLSDLDMETICGRVLTWNAETRLWVPVAPKIE